MRGFMRAVATLSFLIGFLALIAVPGSLPAQEEGSGDESAEDTLDVDEDAEEEVELTDEELAELLTRVDRFYIDQDIARLTVDLDIYRDPSNRLNSRNIREDDPSRISGLSTIVSHFTYEYPEFYELKIMGYVIAGSEVPPDQTFFSQVLPIPGAPVFTESLRERFRIRFEGIDEVDGVPAYRIRYTAQDRDTEFFNYIVYYIDVEREVILRVASSFDNVWYVGTGEGNFYYRERRGMLLPEYGHGSVLFFPNRRFNVWGRWYMWDWESPEEEGGDEEEPIAGDSEPEGGVSDEEGT